ncbi:neutral/alkaline non-lysosomal ceramidase N-terminal domain-containing protein [Psychrobacillus sp. FSL W7-1493]|uniref:neutral/alkaline non-lysosomal ceramidase N-terminal domain-containing protein n=1 Tax=Psychrobacillus sp. FSL W7-1493 TaxID=2921552 RepID=UPI0030FCD2C1
MSKVGIHRIDITPPLGTDFIGYHRPVGIKDITERIYTTAFVFEVNEEKSIFISIDNIGMLIEDTLIIREQISAQLNIEIDRITIVFTHTHSGPATVSDNLKVIKYKNMLVSLVTKTAVKANQKVRHSEIAWNVNEGNLGVNRREPASDDKVTMGINLHGVIDKRIGILVIRDKDSSNLSGVIVFCTAHPNVLKSDSYRLSADFPGTTRVLLEKVLNCKVIVVQGAAGDINPLYRGGSQALNQMAYVLGGHVLTMLPALNFTAITNLKTTSITFPMKLKNVPLPVELHKMAMLAESKWGVNTSKWLNVLLEKYKNKEKAIWIDIEIQSFQLNEGSFTGIPLEPFSETAITFKERLGNELAFFGGYMNGYLGYLPTKDSYLAGGYEVEVNPIIYGPVTGLWMPPEENSAELIVEKALNLLIN